ncbi:TPA: DUF2971 domain-containing protein [Aeromonas dhakensis]|nr:DUF2971 domain-containing protein [Aeromonas dhakensis]
MLTLYKYYSSLPYDYFKNPTIKLSQLALLNDPFEHYMPTQAIHESMKKIFGESYNEQSDHIRMFKKNYKFINATKGIVSLSETHRNLLMWAHYADQHKGLCIGYSHDFLSSLPLPKQYNKVVDKFEPIKINYDRVRFDINDLDFGDVGKEMDYINFILLKSLTTKSDDWMYEKEHRCITPLRWADEIFIKSPEKLSRISTPDYRHILAMDANKGKDASSSLAVEDEFKFLLDNIGQDQQSILLKRISPKKISSIYFGSRMPKQIKTELIKGIKERMDEYQHVKIFEYKIDDTNYELNRKQIYI